MESDLLKIAPRLSEIFENAWIEDPWLKVFALWHFLSAEVPEKLQDQLAVLQAVGPGMN